MSEQNCYYFDTNALIEYYISEDQETSLQATLRHLSSTAMVYVSNLAYLEMLGVLMKLFRAQRIKRKHLNSIIERLKKDIGTTSRHRFQLITIQEEAYQKAQELMIKYAATYRLSTNDSLHIAIASLHNPPVIMVTFDKTVKDFCKEIKLNTYDLELNLIETSETRPILHELNLKKLTLFSEANLIFSPQLNVFIGENATGKTHLLKTTYTILSSIAERTKKNIISPTKEELRLDLSDKFLHIFRTEKLTNLITYQQNQCDISLKFDSENYNIDLSLKTTDPNLQLNDLPKELTRKRPVYLSTRELLSIYPNFVSIYENNYLEFEETWKDACVALGGLVQRNIDYTSQKLLETIEKTIGGKIELDNNGRFYLNTPNKGRLEAPLISEGQRKFAMLARLIMTGALQNGYLFWDEPEANLNPRLIKELAPILLELSLSGIQIFIATHSLFLLRELEILLINQQYKNIQTRWFGLHAENNNVIIEQGDHIDDAGDISSLKEELSQSNRFLKSGV